MRCGKPAPFGGGLRWYYDGHGDIVIMSAELEVAAFSLAGLKLWTTFVEPPWTYRIDGDVIELDVMGKIRRFPLRGGPDAVDGSRDPYR